MARLTAEEKAAAAAQAAAEEKADRERTERDLAEISQFEEEHHRPPTKDELAERRAANATRDADVALEQEMGGGAAVPGGNSGSISERAAQGPPVETDEDDDGQTFFFMGEEVTLATLLKKVKKVRVDFKFTGKRQKGKGGMPKIDGDMFLILRSKPGAYNVVPTRDDNENVESAVIEVKVEPKVLHDALGEDGQRMMAELLHNAGWTVEPPAAAESAAG